MTSLPCFVGSVVAFFFHFLGGRVKKGRCSKENLLWVRQKFARENGQFLWRGKIRRKRGGEKRASKKGKLRFLLLLFLKLGIHLLCSGQSQASLVGAAASNSFFFLLFLLLFGLGGGGRTKGVITGVGTGRKETPPPPLLLSWWGFGVLCQLAVEGQTASKQSTKKRKKKETRYDSFSSKTYCSIHTVL